MRNAIETQPLSVTLMLNEELAAELVHGDPAAMWPGVQFQNELLDGSFQTLYLIQVKGRQQFGLPYSYDTIKVTEWRISTPVASTRNIAPEQVQQLLSEAQLRIVVTWLTERSMSAWMRAADQVRDALGKPEPFFSVAEASRRAGIPVTTLDSAVRTVPQRVPAAQDSRGFYRVRMSALNRALTSGRVRTREGRGRRRVRMTTK